MERKWENGKDENSMEAKAYVIAQQKNNHHFIEHFGVHIIMKPS